ncbi:GNAT family N-acetyltransferase [Longispora albida]|uniref:GNAT family N-acetyltransferase n=1 Tax=Longispora albida TaxID=203523 RepID=UPI00035EFF65|nr:GNAT family N-acetyltransferase [Longispora albida]
MADPTSTTLTPEEQTMTQTPLTVDVDRDIEIVRAAPGDLDVVNRLLTAAFCEPPLAVCAWLVPDRLSLEPVMCDFFAILTRAAAEHGRILLATRAGHPIGAAVWFPRTAPLPDQPDYPAQLSAATGEYLPRFQTLDEAFETRHPHSPHDHLALLGVQPAWRGKGIGGRLLDHAHARMDEVGVPAYLEACDLTSRELYRRHGYEDLGVPIQLPDGGPQIFPMWRPGPGHAA